MQEGRRTGWQTGKERDRQGQKDMVELHQATLQCHICVTQESRKVTISAWGSCLGSGGQASETVLRAAWENCPLKARQYI